MKDVYAEREKDEFGDEEQNLRRDREKLPSTWEIDQETGDESWLTNEGGGPLEGGPENSKQKKGLNSD